MAWILWLLHDYRSACIYHLWWFDIWAPAVIFLIEMAVREFERTLGRSGRCIPGDKLVGRPPQVVISIDCGCDLAKLRIVRTICVAQTRLFVSILSGITIIQDFSKLDSYLGIWRQGLVIFFRPNLINLPFSPSTCWVCQTIPCVL